jgi:hypothetical protein
MKEHDFRKSRKKPHRIWSYYEAEILVRNLKCGFKRNMNVLCVLHLKSVMWHNLIGANSGTGSKYEY